MMTEEGVGKSCPRSSSCSQKKLEFLRVLVPNPFAKLRIPGRIADSLQTEPYNRATLHVRHGKFYHVGLRRENGDLYLDDEGWKEFAEALKLRTGYFVLFRYKVNMVFSVKVYDNTMCLVEYAPDCFSSKKRSVHDLYDDAVRTVGVFSNNKDNMYCSVRSSPKKKTLETRNHVGKWKNGMERIDGRIYKRCVKGKNSISPIFPRFIKIVKSSHSHSDCLWIPEDFCVRHKLVSGCEYFLVNSTGKTWRGIFSDGKLSGFRDFARDNELRKGDRCTFQLINANTLLVRVMGSGVDKQHCSPTLQNDNMNKGPEFERVVTRCYLHNMYIPKVIRESIGLVSDCDVVLMNREGKSWPVEFFFKVNGEGHLGFGWGKFRRENHINMGDRCIFKLIEKNVFLVNKVHEENRDELCNEIHDPAQQVPNEEDVSAKHNNSPSVILALKAVQKNKRSSLLSIEKDRLNSIGIEKIPENEQENSSIDYVEKAATFESQNEKLQNKLITVCVEKAPCVIAQKEIEHNNSDVISMSNIEDETIVEQKKSSSLCVITTPPSDAQKEKVEKRRNLRLPSLDKRTLFEVHQKTDDWGSVRFPKIEKIIVPYNVNGNKMVLSKEFCKKADLCTPRCIILKDSEGKTWRVNYNPNNGRGNLRWEKFVTDKKLKVGDKCIFKLVAHDTLLVNVVRK